MMAFDSFRKWFGGTDDSAKDVRIEKPMKHEGEIKLRGSIATEAGGHHGDQAWVGSISPATRIREGRLTIEEEDRFINPETLETYYTPVDPKAATSCIDGRPTADGTYQASPQVPGGTVGAALVHRIVDGIVDGKMPPGATFTGDIEDTLDDLKKAGIVFGGHIDEHGKLDHNKSGCGAIDKIPQILNILADPIAQKQIRHLMQGLLGQEYNESMVSDLFGRIQTLHDQESSYLEQDKNDPEKFAYRAQWKHIVNAKAHKDHKPVQELVGDHNEVALVVNTVPNTTLNRARLNQDSGGMVQIFNYDLWRSRKMAETLYQGDAYKQQEFLMCRVMFAIATAMALTDGSIRIGVRTQK